MATEKPGGPIMSLEEVTEVVREFDDRIIELPNGDLILASVIAGVNILECHPYDESNFQVNVSRTGSERWRDEIGGQWRRFVTSEEGGRQ